jgi:plasmid stabilization system protein ParE
MSQLRLTRNTRQDLDAIFDFVAESDGVGRADSVADSIFNALILIRAFPNLGRRRLDLQTEVRSFVVNPFRIYYRVTKNVVLVLRIRHGAQLERRGFLEEN